MTAMGGMNGMASMTAIPNMSSIGGIAGMTDVTTNGCNGFNQGLGTNNVRLNPDRLVGNGTHAQGTNSIHHKSTNSSNSNCNVNMCGLPTFGISQNIILMLSMQRNK